MKETIRPSYYKKNGGIEVVEFTNSHNLNLNIGNVVKYIVRSPYKNNQVEDLKKAIQYLKFETIKIEVFDFGEIYLKPKGIDASKFINSHKLEGELHNALHFLLKHQQPIQASLLIEKYINRQINKTN